MFKYSEKEKITLIYNTVNDSICVILNQTLFIRPIDAALSNKDYNI